MRMSHAEVQQEHIAFGDAIDISTFVHVMKKVK